MSDQRPENRENYFQRSRTDVRGQLPANFQLGVTVIFIALVGFAVWLSVFA